MTNPDDSAFATHPGQPNGLSAEEWQINYGTPGFTKREWFAGLAMHDAVTALGYPFTSKESARRSVEYADALIAELNKAGESGK